MCRIVHKISRFISRHGRHYSIEMQYLPCNSLDRSFRSWYQLQWDNNINYIKSKAKWVLGNSRKYILDWRISITTYWGWIIELQKKAVIVIEVQAQLSDGTQLSIAEAYISQSLRFLGLKRPKLTLKVFSLTQLSHIQVSL